jgi:hypothetical protein
MNRTRCITRARITLGVLLAGLWISRAHSAMAQLTVVDLAQTDPQTQALRRVYGSVGDGTFGVPVCGPFDCDGDGLRDYAFSAFLGDPMSRIDAGEVYLVFGDGSVSGTADTAGFDSRILKIAGSGASENAGSELWMDDVTGDGIGDLLIGRQNFVTPLGLVGAGALSIVIGGPQLRAYAATEQYLDLASVPESLTVTTLMGAHPLDRLGIWMRSGDVTGDGLGDLLVAADQEDHDGEEHAGVSYLIRGGPHLAIGGEVDLGDLSASPLATEIVRILPPPNANEYHLGATCQLADLDRNGRAEVLLAAALNRAGAGRRPLNTPPGSTHAVGGPPRGLFYILWDDNFGSGPWPQGHAVSIGEPPGSRTVLRGDARHSKFGEEIIGGLDYDGDGTADLFVGDLTGDGSEARNRPTSGLGHILFNAPALKNVDAAVDALPPQVGNTVFIGANSGDIAADTTVHGDFDDDGIADVAFSSPHANPAGRSNAGIVHVFHGQPQPWPASVDLREVAAAGVRVTEVWGARGDAGSDAGDVLAYSASAGDVDFDGRSDLIINEMTGNGSQARVVDVGNLLVVGAPLLGAGSPCPPQPLAACERSALRSRLELLRGHEPARNRFWWRWLGREDTAIADFGDPIYGLANYAVCVYDSSGGVQPLLAASALAGGECLGPRCWSTAGDSGFRYRTDDTRPDGLQRVRLAAGVFGAGRLELRGRGGVLRLPEAPLVMPAIVRLVISVGASSECWQAEYQTAIRNEAGRFVARIP